MPFDGDNAAAYRGLEAGEFSELVLGEPKGRTKKTPMLQIADLYLYPPWRRLGTRRCRLQAETLL